MSETRPGRTPHTARRGLPALGAALSLLVIFLAVLAVPLDAAEKLGLSAGETTAWIMGGYGIPSALALVLTLRFRQPLMLTGNIFVLILISRLGTDFAWAELIGSTMIAGGAVLILSPTGLLHRLAAWLPAPIVFGLLAGAVLPFFVEMFAGLGDEPVMVGGAILVYLAARRTIGSRIPPILPALVALPVLAAVTGAFEGRSLDLGLTAPSLTAPDFSLGAILTVAPVLVVLITVEANVPSLVFLREHDYAPPEAAVNSISGAGTAAGSLFGPFGVSLSLPATALCAGPSAGDHDVRHWSVYIAALGGVGIALLASLAVEISAAVPSALLATGVGLAVVEILSGSLQQVTRGPLIWGPLFAFAIPQATFTMLGLSEFFWAIAGGLIVSLLVEREALAEWQEAHRDREGHARR